MMGLKIREARLVYRDGKTFLMIVKKIPKPIKYSPRGILAVDVNENHVVLGNRVFEKSIETPVKRALHYKILAENLQKKYSFGRYRAWTRKGVLKRINHFHRRARNIVEDWTKKTDLDIARTALQHLYAIGGEDLNGLIESIRELPKNHRKKLILLTYRRIVRWIDWRGRETRNTSNSRQLEGNINNMPIMWL